MKLKDYIQMRPVAYYFISTFIVSWLGAFILIAPKLFHGVSISKMDGILMFPIMLVGPCVCGIVFTYLTQGKKGLRNLRSRMLKWQVPVKWYLAALLIPSCLILITLMVLEHTISFAFQRNFYLIGFLFGIPAGVFEEIGWTGFAFPQMRIKNNFVKSSMLLGVIWGLWHLPVIDFLGAASPHGQYLFLFGLAFIAAMTAMRVIICWMYEYTHSVLLAQFTHIVSTGCLVVFGPQPLSAGMETLWYSGYALLLWLLVVSLFIFKGIKNLPSVNFNVFN